MKTLYVNAAVVAALTCIFMKQLAYTSAQLADAIGLSRQTIYNRISTNGDLPPYVRIGSRPHFRVSDVEQWLAAKPANEPMDTMKRRRPGRPTKAEQVARRRKSSAKEAS